jgi:hypothetical protein
MSPTSDQGQAASLVHLTKSLIARALVVNPVQELRSPWIEGAITVIAVWAFAVAVIIAAGPPPVPVVVLAGGTRGPVIGIVVVTVRALPVLVGVAAGMVAVRVPVLAGGTRNPIVRVLVIAIYGGVANRLGGRAVMVAVRKILDDGTPGQGAGEHCDQDRADNCLDRFVSHESIIPPVLEAGNSFCYMSLRRRQRGFCPFFQAMVC